MTGQANRMQKLFNEILGGRVVHGRPDEMAVFCLGMQPGECTVITASLAR